VTKQQTDGRIFQIRGVMGHACFLIYASNEPKSVLARDLGDCRDNERQRVYASNESKSVHARDLGDCRDNLRNSRSVFLIVYLSYKSESDFL